MTWYADDYESSRRWPLNEIEEMAIKLRKECGHLDTDPLDLVTLFMQLGVKLVTSSDAAMGGAKALAKVEGKAQILLTHGLYKNLIEGEPAARYDLGHELGHLILHRGSNLRALTKAGNKELKFISPEYSVENQAWQYSRALFLPRAFLKLKPEAIDLAALSGVPVTAVLLRCEEIEKSDSFGKPRKSPIEVLKFLDRMKKNENDRLQRVQKLRRVQKRTSILADEKLISWNNCAKHFECDPEKWRVTRGFVIAWDHYGLRDSHCGWTIRNGEARAFMDLDGI
jgi:Zn-dependent peptidase ImmA (M78 family)